MSKMLSSWKEIAQYFGKGVRTVQRWEKTLALPIYRPPGAPSNVVLARTSDLEAWMNRGPAERAAVQSPRIDEAELDAAIALLEQEVRSLHSVAGTSGANRAVPIDSEPEADAVARIHRAVADLRTVHQGLDRTSLAA